MNPPRMLSVEEEKRLLAYWHAQKRQREHIPILAGKRAVKGRAKGVGQLLKNSHCMPQVGIERVFVTRRSL